jgi:hypothetical protein
MTRFLNLLEDGYSHTCENLGPMTRLEFLADHIFDFTTYESETSELFAVKALEVCEAINGRTTFDYIKDADSRCWFLIMVNMPFFAERISWGTSIRGAWWDGPSSGGPIEYDSCGLYDGERQVTETLKFDRAAWAEFIAGVLAFAGNEGRTEAHRQALRFHDTATFDVFKCGNCGADQRVERK